MLALGQYGHNDVSFERWIEMDLQYIDNRSLKLDFILLVKTVKICS